MPSLPLGVKKESKGRKENARDEQLGFIFLSQQTGRRGQKQKLYFLHFSLDIEQWKWKRNNLKIEEVCAS